MAWDIAPATGVDFLDWKFQRQFDRALIEKALATGSTFYPKTNQIQDSGTIGSITETLLTDGSSPGKSWGLPAVDCSGKRWYGLSCPNAPWDPEFYDVIITTDPCQQNVEETEYYRAQISDNSATTLTLAAGLSDYVTAGYLSSISDLEDCPYYIIKRDGLFPYDINDALARLIAYPNDNQLWRGLVVSSTANSITTRCMRPWGTDQLKDKELLVFGSDSRLHRFTITGNSGTKLNFSGSTGLTYEGEFIIVEAGGKGFPNRQGGYPQQWYGGAADQYLCHAPSDGFDHSFMPADQVCWETGTPVTTGDPCVNVCHNAFDKDVWTAVDEECNSPLNSDRCYSPNLYKTHRGRQLATENFAPKFVKPIDWTGKQKIDNYTFAVFFNTAGINNYSSTVSDKVGAGDYAATVDSSLEGVGVFWTVMNADGTVHQDMPVDGEGNPILATVSGGKIDLGSGLYDSTDEATNCFHHSDVGKTVLYSPGWTRYVQRAIRYLRPKSIFIPDSAEDTGFIDAASVVDFADSACYGVGTFYRRGASTTYKDRTSEGFAIDGTESPQDGDVAVYVGDGNYADPSVRGSVTLAGTAAIPASAEDATSSYWDRFYTGQLSPKHNYVWRNMLRGTVTSATANTITDSSKNWFDGIWFNVGGGAMRTESGTATGGSSTTLIDASVTTDDSRKCFWDAARFSGFGAAYEGFILEVDKVVGGNTITYKAVIVSANKSTGTITFVAVSGLTVASGDAYRVREPYEPRRFEGAQVIVTERPASTDPVTHTGTLGSNDQTSLWVTWDEGSVTVQNDWTFEIMLPEVGMTITYSDEDGWSWDCGSKSGKPTVVKKYGRAMIDDMVGLHLWDELYKALNVERHTKDTYVWTNKDTLDPDGFVDEYLSDIGSGSGHIGDDISDAEGSWGSDTESIDGLSPFSQSDLSSGGSGDHVDFSAASALGKATKPTCLAAASDWYTVADFYPVGRVGTDPSIWTTYSSTGCVGDKTVDWTVSATETSGGHTVTVSMTYTASTGKYSYTANYDDGSSVQDWEEFNDNGVPVLFLKEKLWRSEDSNQDATVETTDTLGSLSVPAMPHSITDYDPISNPHAAASSAGYQIIESTVIFRWDANSDGMTYID